MRKLNSPTGYEMMKIKMNVSKRNGRPIHNKNKTKESKINI